MGDSPVRDGIDDGDSDANEDGGSAVVWSVDGDREREGGFFFSSPP